MSIFTKLRKRNANGTSRRSDNTNTTSPRTTRRSLSATHLHNAASNPIHASPNNIITAAQWTNNSPISKPTTDPLRPLSADLVKPIIIKSLLFSGYIRRSYKFYVPPGIIKICILFSDIDIHIWNILQLLVITELVTPNSSIQSPPISICQLPQPKANEAWTVCICVFLNDLNCFSVISHL